MQPSFSAENLRTTGAARVMAGDSQKVKLSIVLPVRSTDEIVPAIWDSIRRAKEALAQETPIFVDENSIEVVVATFDGTSKTASRAHRLNLGIKQSKGKVILLHHPRSVIEPEGILELVKNSDKIFQENSWGGFTHRFDEWGRNSLALRFTSWYSNYVRGRNVVYLDHCIWMSRDLVVKDKLKLQILNENLPENKDEGEDACHPFVPEIDIFEDTALSRKLISLSNSQPKILRHYSTTSSVRFKNNGIVQQVFMNQVLKFGYFLGISPRWMNQFYEKGLNLNQVYLHHNREKNKPE